MIDRADWWVSLTFPRPSEYALSVTTWGCDVAVIVTTDAVYRATLDPTGIPTLRQEMSR